MLSQEAGVERSNVHFRNLSGRKEGIGLKKKKKKKKKKKERKKEKEGSEELEKVLPRLKLLSCMT